MFAAFSLAFAVSAFSCQLAGSRYDAWRCCSDHAASAKWKHRFWRRVEKRAQIAKSPVRNSEPIAAGLGTHGAAYYDGDFDRAAGHILSPPLSRDPTTPEALLDLLSW